MVVVMTGSPVASAYPGPSAVVWANRAQKDIETNRQRTEEFKGLQQKQLEKAKKKADAKKAKRQEENAKFQARQQGMREKQNAERESRAARRAEMNSKISSSHDEWLARENERERQKFEGGRQHLLDIKDGVHREDEIEEEYRMRTNQMENKSKAALAEQRRVDEAFEAERLAKMKADREAKANELREKIVLQKEAEARAERDLAARVKKEMQIDTKKQGTVAEQRETAQRARGLDERKKNDEYDAWLAQDHIRTVAERSHERADPSKMHEGGKFSGIPTDFTPGV